MRRYIGRSRVRAEWENLLYFQKHGIPTARLVAFGERRASLFRREGMLVTEEVPGAIDLLSLMTGADAKRTLGNRSWTDALVSGLAGTVSLLHANNFFHGDLKWRNILVRKDQPSKVFLIDCPMGRKLPGFLRERGIVKDLACLDKVAKYSLSRTKRMAFYHKYTGKMRLDDNDKRRIRRILRFFKGRE